jgi:hypothetical protein
MKLRKKLLMALALALPACSDGGSSPGGFADFVAGQLTMTADDSDAVAINDLDFSDASSEDENLFDGILD